MNSDKLVKNSSVPAIANFSGNSSQKLLGFNILRRIKNSNVFHRDIKRKTHNKTSYVILENVQTGMFQ